MTPPSATAGNAGSASGETSSKAASSIRQSARLAVPQLMARSRPESIRRAIVRGLTWASAAACLMVSIGMGP